jgi:hypothetical protein
LASEDWETAARLIDHAGAAPLLQDLELGGAYGEWLDVTRAEIDARIADGLARHIAARESVGDISGVKALAMAWLRRDPLSEPGVAALIRAEIAAGARAAAHIRYQAFRDLLAAEIGVAPGPLVDAALRSEALAEPLVVPAPTGAPAPAPAAAAAPGPDGLVLAVLAFDNLSSDPDLADFCDGVSEEIQRTVARGTGIAVVARASSFQFRVQTRRLPRSLPRLAHRTSLMARCGAVATGCASLRSWSSARASVRSGANGSTAISRMSSRWRNRSRRKSPPRLNSR